MTELTAEAQGLLDEYLRQADVYLRSTPMADAEEVERDLREHVARELQEAPRPVSAADMEAVLRRLGPPEDLVPEEERSWWQRFAGRWHPGTQDWRLALLSRGVLMLTPWGGWLAVLGSFLVARAALETVPEARDLGPQRWLLYPGLFLFYVPFAYFLFAWPVAGPPLALVRWSPDLVRAIADLWRFLPDLHNSAADFLYRRGLHSGWAWLLLLHLVLGLWWLILALIARRFPRLLPMLFRPFLRASDWKSLGGMMLLSFVLTWLQLVSRMV